MPDHLVDTKKKTVNLKCSFFRLLGKFVKQRRMTRVQKQTFLPEGRLRVQQRVVRYCRDQVKEMKIVSEKQSVRNVLRAAHIPNCIKEKTNCSVTLMHKKWKQSLSR